MRRLLPRWDFLAYRRIGPGIGRTRAVIPSELTWVDDEEHIGIISYATVSKCVCRYRADGVASPADYSSRPHFSRRRRWGRRH